MDKIIALSKRRGFVFQSSDIYGGNAGFWDFGPLGVELERNIKDIWWNWLVWGREDIVGLDSAIITNPKVWEASGHVSSFSDPLIECKVCHERFRADQPDEIQSHEQKHKKNGIKDVLWTEARQFNLLFRTFIGPVEDNSNLAYLRGETCQGIFINFSNIIDSTRIKIPFGIAQIGKAFRNEVTPGKFLFRLREFEQMELEYFVHPSSASDSLNYWKEQNMAWLLSLGLTEKNLRFRQHEPQERAHYAADSWDIEYNFPEWGFKELEGIANRTDFDLKTHSLHSGKDLVYKDPVSGEQFVPYVIEPSIGISRLILAILSDAYHEDEKRTILKIHPRLAPVKAAVFPLVANKPELMDRARKVYTEMKEHFRCAWDDRGNIGKRYLSQDEIGTPWCITVDYDTLDTDTVTVRDRNTTNQERIGIGRLISYISDKMKVKQ